MTTTYELYTNENGTPKAVEGKAPAIIERVEALETDVKTLEGGVESVANAIERVEALEADVEALEGTLDNGVVTSVNDETGSVYVKKLIMGDHVLELQEDGTLKLDENLVITSAGGTIKGQVALRAMAGDEYKSSIYTADQTKELMISSGSANYSDSGGYLSLYGRRHPHRPSSFCLTAKGDDKYVELMGEANGDLSWGGKSIERVQKSLTKSFVRYDSGIQFCWGISYGSRQVTFDAPFASIPIVLTSLGSAIDTSCNSSVYTSSVTTTTFETYKLRGNSASQVEDEGTFYWFAFGHWK